MFEFLLQADKHLFYLINRTLANPVFDVVMPFVTTEEHFVIPLILLWLGLLLFGGRRERIAALLILPTLLLSDQLSSSILKPLVGRIRPCNALPDVRLLDRCTHSFSFPSSHATNIFAAAGLLSGFYRKYRGYFYGIAVLVAYSRPYVGVHYPSDVLFGAWLGWMCGWAVLSGYRALSRRYPVISLTGEEKNKGG